MNIGMLAFKIDECDMDLIRDYNWSTVGDNYLCGSNGKYSLQYLHRIIAERMGLDLSNLIDHRDGDKFNNHRSNLRSATHSQNGANSKLHVANISGYKGVGWQESRQKWRARICVNYKLIHLGYFDTAEDAHKAYCKAADKYFGEFANHGSSF